MADGTEEHPKSKRYAQHVRKSVAKFLGVAGDTSDEWKNRQGDWQRRSMALHQQGRLLSKVGQDQRGQTPSSTVSDQGRADGGLKGKQNVMGRPSALQVTYKDIRERVQKSRHPDGRESETSPPVSRHQPQSSPRQLSPPPTPTPASSAMSHTSALTPALTPSGHSLKSAKSAIEKKLKFIEPEPEERELGKGLVGDLLNREYRKSRLVSEVRMNMASLTAYRPFFTYWVTFVQIVVFIVIISLYGVGPIGIGLRVIKGEAPRLHAIVEDVYYTEEENMWIGPAARDLIHAGAKFSPCMRSDYLINEAIKEDQDIEREKACCIHNDESGCVMTSRHDCSSLMADWKKWPDNNLKNDRTSGSVCGLDPKYCENPPPTLKDHWPDDITKWPECIKYSGEVRSPNYTHMTCEVIGRPCCVGIQGECLITTDKHCAFLRGHFYPNKSLCSQVFCMDDICGMIAFYEPKAPDQFGRLVISQFIHAGLIQLLVTIVYQAFIMRDLEKLIGWLRLSIIYIFSGIAGSLASASFLPYHVEAGPSGSQFGVAACLFVEVIQNWYILYNPWMALLKLSVILLILFIIGLLPMIDNYSHLFGFIYGFLLAFALMPYITFNVEDKKFKLIGVIVCLSLAVVLLLILILIFYVTPITSCTPCQYFNCIPFTENFCASMEIKISRNKTWYA